jgi:hypothetical protein
MDQNERQLVYDRIEQLKYLQKPSEYFMDQIVPFLTFLFTIVITLSIFYVSRIDSNKPETFLVNILSMLKIFIFSIFIWVIVMVILYLFMRIHNKYDSKIKKNYELLLGKRIIEKIK